MTGTTHTSSPPPLPDDAWTRDVALLIAVWMLASLVAIMMLFAVVEGALV